jgi:hypothetical protein
LPKRVIQSWYLLRPMPIQGMKRATAMSVLSAQERTKKLVARVVGDPAVR